MKYQTSSFKANGKLSTQSSRLLEFSITRIHFDLTIGLNHSLKMNSQNQVSSFPFAMQFSLSHACRSTDLKSPPQLNDSDTRSSQFMIMHSHIELKRKKKLTPVCPMFCIYKPQSLRELKSALLMLMQMTLARRKSHGGSHAGCDCDKFLNPQNLVDDVA